MHTLPTSETEKSLFKKVNGQLVVVVTSKQKKKLKCN